MSKFLNAIAPVWKPHKGQSEFLASKAPIKVLACGRRWGKTDACAIEIMQALITKTGKRHLIVAPTLDQASLLFERLIELLLELKPHWPFGTFPNEFVVTKSPYPKLKFGSQRVTARSGHIGRSLRGNEASHIVIDEAAYVPEELVTEIAMPMLATTQGTLTLISTPRGRNHFWRLYQLGQQSKHRIWSRSAPSSESPYVSHEFLKAQQELISERAYRTEYEAVFGDSEGQVFRTESLDTALVARLPNIGAVPVSIGVDWARYTDHTVVSAVAGYRQNAQVWQIDRFTGLPWREQVRRVGRIAHRFPGASIISDATGVGDPLLEMLREELPGHSIQGYVFTQHSKAALIDNLAWMFENATLKMESHPELLRELQHFESSINHSGSVKLAAAQGFHDDTVIALALGCHGLRSCYAPSIQLGGERRFYLEAKHSCGNHKFHTTKNRRKK